MFPRAFNPAEPELMDRPQPVTPELEVDLTNLAGINRHFGSYRLIRHFLARWLQAGGSYRVLDLCTASGDIPRLMIDWARARGVTLEIDAVDFQVSTLEVARQRSAGYPEITFHVGDVRHFNARPGEYDFVFCSLALHHFDAEDALELLIRCRELASRAALVADLERSRSAALAVWLLTAVIYRAPMTKADARESVRRAFSYSELRDLARRASWTAFGQARFRWARQAVWLEQETV